MVVPFMVLIIFIFLAVTIVRAAARAASQGSSTRPRPAMPTGVLTEIAPDGFWLTAPSANPGDTVCYEFWSAGQRRSGQVVFQPGNDGRQFIYTGPRPESITISRVIGGGQRVDPDVDLGATFAGAAAAGVILDSMTRDDPDPTPPRPPPISSFPSAY